MLPKNRFVTFLVVCVVSVGGTLGALTIADHWPAVKAAMGFKR